MSRDTRFARRSPTQKPDRVAGGGSGFWLSLYRGTFPELAKHFRVYLALVRMNVMSQMEYRANFVTGILMELGYLVVKLLYVFVAFRAGRDIAGFGPDEMMVFVGTFITATGLYAGLYMMNFFQLSTLVADGSFDTLMTKPVSLQFMATLRRCDVGIFLIDAIGGIAVTAIGLARMSDLLELWRVLGYALFLLCGSAVGYAIYLLPQCLVFRIVNARAIAGVSDSFWDFNNVPMVVYDKIGQAIGTYLLPMFVITSFPSLFALGRMSGSQMIWGCLAPVVFIAVSRFAWKSGIRNYSSASG
jgi:ABC-2 type transport system permease protein